MPKPRVFVAMPFGEKPDFGGGDIIDFDWTYDHIIAPAIETAGGEAVRADREYHNEIIYDRMVRNIESATVFLADITIHNANVFYELGVRHVMRRGKYVIIGAEGCASPFNIQGLNRVDYNRQDVAGSIEKISKHVEEAIGSSENPPASPIYKAFQHLQVVRNPARPFDTSQVFRFSIDGAPDVSVEAFTGDLFNITNLPSDECYEAITVSENNRLDLPSIYEKSVSARVHNFARISSGNSAKDVVGADLKKQTKSETEFKIGDVFITTSGNWAKVCGVEKLVHAVAVRAQAGGFSGDVGSSVTATRRVLNKIDEVNSKRWSRKLKSVVLPVFGTGQAGVDIRDVMGPMVSQICNHFLGPRHSKILNRVGILCYDDTALMEFASALKAENRIAYTDEQIGEIEKTVEQHRKG